MSTEQEAIKLYIPGADADWLRQHCDDEGLTVAGLVRKLIREYRAKVEAKAVA